MTNGKSRTSDFEAAAAPAWEIVQSLVDGPHCYRVRIHGHEIVDASGAPAVYDLGEAENLEDFDRKVEQLKQSIARMAGEPVNFS